MRRLAAVLGVAVAVDLEVHPRLAHLTELAGGRRAAVGRAGVDDCLQLARGVAPHQHRRVDDEVDGAAHPQQLGRDRVDQEGHVVGDDLDDGVAAGPAVLLESGVEHVDVDGADGTIRRQLAVRERRAENVLRRPREQVLGGDVTVVPAQEPLDPVTPVLDLLGGSAQVLLT